MDIWLKSKFVGFIRKLIKKESEEKNYIESQDLFGEEIYQNQKNENSKKKKSFVLKLFDNNKIINRRSSLKYSSSTELIKDLKLCKKNNYNYFRHNSDSKLPIMPIIAQKEILIQTFQKEKYNMLFKITGYLLTLLKHYLEIYIPKHKANVINSITKHKTYEEFLLAFKYYIIYLVIFTLLTNMSSWIQDFLIYIFSIKDTKKNKNIMLESVLQKDMEFFDKNKIEDIHKDLKTFQKGPININLVEMCTQLILYGTKFLYILYYLYINFYDDVYETLQDFSKAGIKLWVLTGDKKNTAKSIAFSCGLIDDKNFNILEIGEGLNKIGLESRLNELAEQFNSIIDSINIKTNSKKENKNNNIIINNKKEQNKTKFALIISSNELNIISLNYELEILFYELASRCNSVLCCRVSPIQKAKMVHLIQRFTKIKQRKGANYYKYLNQQDIYQVLEQDEKKKIKGPLKDSITTLAIGDGANDVNMITSAHIGVGICGLEGKQAARASDYAIGQFKFLKKLLFYHGHESLRKNSFIICYNFYKNFLFVMPLFYIGFYSFFSGQTIYDPWLYQLYNIAFTVFPIIWFGIYDSERTRTETLNNPKYYSGLTQKWFNSWKFWEWIFYGIIQGYAVFFFIYSSNNIYSHNLNGEIQDFKCSGAMAYSVVIIIANIKVFQVTSVYSFISLFLIIISIASYYGLIYLMDKNYAMFYFGIFWIMIKNYRYYLIMICLSLGLNFISAGISQIQKICSHYDKKEKHNKIMFSFKELRNKENKKNTKNENENDIISEEGNKQNINLIEKEI